MTYQDQLAERRETLENLKDKADEIQGQDETVDQRIDMLLRKMARTIDRSNFDVYESEVRALIEAQEVVGDER